MVNRHAPKLQFVVFGIAVLFFGSCTILKPIDKEKGFGGLWLPADSNLAVNRPKEVGLFKEIPTQNLKIASSNLNIGSQMGKIVCDAQRLGNKKFAPRFPHKISADSTESKFYQPRKDAKDALFVTMGGGILYFISYLLLGQPAFSLLMWLPAIANPLLLILGVVLVLGLFIAFFMAIRAMKDMKINQNQDGKQFAIIALLGSLGMLISMAPLVVVTLVLVIYWLLTQ